MILYDSVNSVPGAQPVVLPPRSAWMDNTIDLPRLAQWVTALPDYATHLILDVERRDVMPLDVRYDPPSKVIPGIQTAQDLVRTVKAARPSLQVSMYDAFIEDATVCYNATTARHRMFNPVDEFDEHFKNQSPAAQIALAAVETANDFLEPLHAELDFITARAYFPFGWDAHPRRMMIRWANGEGHRIAKGKPVMLLYKPDTQSGPKKWREHGAIEMAQDAAAFRTERVPAVCMYRHQKTTATKMVDLARIVGQSATYQNAQSEQ